jgi:hypothetical protein
MPRARTRRSKGRGNGVAQPIHWRAIGDFLKDRSGNPLQLYREVSEAYARGDLPGRCPHRATFYRRCRDLQDSAPQCPEAPAPTLARAPRRAGSPKLRAAIARLEQARAEHEAAARALVEIGLFGTDDRLRLDERMKRSSGRSLTKAAAQGAAAIEAIAADIEHVTETFRRRATTPSPTATEPTEHLPVAPPFLVNGVDPADPVFGTGSQVVSDSQRHTLPQPRHGQVLTRTRSASGNATTAAKGTLIAPVLNGRMTPREAAAYWRAEFSKVLSAAGHPGTEGISRELCRKYRKLSQRQIERWLARVREDRKLAARVGLPDPSIASSLSHAYPDSRRGPEWPELRRKAQEVFKNNPGWTAGNVADHLRDTGEWQGTDNRLIERYIAEIPDRDRAEARGGPAGPEILKKRLIRQAPYPNHVWHIDHSWIDKEIVAPDYTGPFEDEVTRAYGLMSFAMEDRNLAGWVARKVVRGMWMTKIVDLCTRKSLVIRLWPCAPNTRTTLLALRDAIERYGIPDVFYSDNGSDLKNHVVRAVLKAVGIYEVHSRPWTPQGGGANERSHLTIATRVLPHLRGWCGGAVRQWDPADLHTQEELESLIREKTETLINERVHSTTRRIPNRHYEEEIGARPLGGAGRREVEPEAWLPLLTVTEDAVLHDYGVELMGHRFYHESFGDVMEGRTLRVYHDPYKPRYAHVALPGPDGAVRYLGLAERYTHPDSPPPTAWMQAQQEARWREAQRDQLAAREQIRIAEQRTESAKLAGETEGRRLAATAPELRLLVPPPPMLALPPASSGPAPTDQGLSAEAIPVDSAGATPQHGKRKQKHVRAVTPSTEAPACLPARGREQPAVLINPYLD